MDSTEDLAIVISEGEERWGGETMAVSQITSYCSYSTIHFQSHTHTVNYFWL